MEGTFVTPGANWSLIWVASGLGIACLVFLGLSILVDAAAIRSMRNHQDEASLAEDRIGVINPVVNTAANSPAVFFFGLAFVMLVGSIISLIFGFSAGGKSLNSVDCFDTKYATEGVYAIKDAKLIFPSIGSWEDDKFAGYVPGEPEYFAMHLEGKVENDSATKAVVCIRVSYDSVWESYTDTYIPSLEGIISKKPIGGFTIPIDLPQYAIKSNGNWWIFSDAVPAQ